MFAFGRACLAGAALAISTSAGAATYDFSYSFSSGASLHGTLIGEINAQNPLVLDVTAMPTISITDSRINSYDHTSTYSFLSPQNAEGKVSLDGSVMSMVGYNDDTRAVFYVLKDWAPFDPNTHITMVETGVQPYEVFRPGAWHMSLVTSVPEPESLAMMVAGLLALGTQLRRRRRCQILTPAN